MLKVLIADDEKKVCQLIANLIDWEALGFEIAGVVNDGISAYRFIQENTVNLMITDIRMPGCDGMELIQKVKVLVLLVDGAERKLKRTYYEIWSTKRGSAAETFDGHSPDFYVNGVPVKKLSTPI